MISTEAVVYVKVVDRKEDDETKHLCLFEIRTSLDFFDAFLDYRPPSGNDHIVKRSIIQLARLGASIGTDLTCLEQWEERGGHGGNVCADTFRIHVSEAVDQLIVQIREFVQIWVAAELELSFEITVSASEKDGKQKGTR